MRENQRLAAIRQHLSEADYYEEQAVFCRHFGSSGAASKEYWDSKAKLYDEMSRKRREKAKELERE